MKKKILAVLLGVSMVVALTACGSTTEEAAPAADAAAEEATDDAAAADEAAPAAEGLKVGIAMKTLNGPYFVKLCDTIEAGCEEKGWECTTLVADEDIAKEAENIETFITNGCDVIYLDSIDPDACIPAIDEAASAGIPVINIDSGVNGGDYMVTVYSNNRENGRLSGYAWGEWLEAQGKGDEEVIGILLSGKKGNVAGEERRGGLFAGLVQYRTGCTEEEAWAASQDIEDQLVAGGVAENADAKFKIVGQGWGNWTVEDGLTASEDFITANPDVTAILGENDQMLFGAKQALEAAGLTGVQLVAAADGACEAFDLIKINDTEENPYIVSGLNSPVLVGQTALQIAEDYILNGDPADYADFDDAETKVKLTEAAGVTKDLVDQYYEVGF